MSVDTGADAARRSICDARTESACVRARRTVYKGRCCVDARVSERCPTDTYSSVHVMSRLLLLLLLLLPLPTVGIVSSATLNRRSLSVRRCGRRVVGSASERAIKVGAGTGHLPPRTRTSVSPENYDLPGAAAPGLEDLDDTWLNSSKLAQP